MNDKFYDIGTHTHIHKSFIVTKKLLTLLSEFSISIVYVCNMHGKREENTRYILLDMYNNGDVKL